MSEFSNRGDLSSKGSLPNARSEVKSDVTKQLRCAIDDYNAASPDAASEVGDPQTRLKLN